MSDRDTTHLLEELQHARSLADSHERAFRQANLRCVELMDELDRLRRLIRDQTGVMVQGQTFWPDWVMEELGAEATRPGGAA